MILRILTLMLMLSGSITAPLFAGTARGNHLFQEGGGAVGIPGIAGPPGAPGVAGAAGAAGVQGIPGIPGAPGILDYSDFYALQGVDNSPVAADFAVQFPRNGSTTGTINRTGFSTFLLPTIGTYLVQFQVDVREAAQLQLRLNNVPLPDTVVGRATGQTQIIGLSLVTTTTSASVLEVINPSSNVTLDVSSGTNPAFGDQSGNNPVSAHLVIVRIQ